MKILAAFALFACMTLSGCGYRLGLGPQRVAQAGVSGPVIIDFHRPNMDLPAL